MEHVGIISADLTQPSCTVDDYRRVDLRENDKLIIPVELA